MRGRSSQRAASSSEVPAADDWGDGSWTVDCVCGVNFDDGEEMVSCDECGVWVHTRCVRFVKGETSFSCDKCKGKRPSNFSNDNQDFEENEVAQLLAEMPTKTLKFDASPAVGAAFRLPSHVPIHERVHVQGIPGGDPSFYEGFEGSVFSRQLWICSGYVPKKLSFEYREFPCWDDRPDVNENADMKPLEPSDGDALKDMEEDRPVVSEGRTVSSEGEKGAAILCQVGASKEKVSVSLLGSEWRNEDCNSPRRGEGSRRSDVNKGQKQHSHQGSRGEKHHGHLTYNHHHHHGHHHQGKRKRDEGGSVNRDYSKKRLKGSGDRDRDRDREDSSRRRGGSQDGSYSSKGHRSGVKNPKSMRNLAAQRFLDDDVKSGASKAELTDVTNHAGVSFLVGYSQQRTSWTDDHLENQQPWFWPSKSGQLTLQKLCTF